MTRRIGIFTTLLFLFTATCIIQAQQTQAPSIPAPSDIPKPRPVAKSSVEDTAPAIYYRLEFTIRELDREKLVDTRNYNLSVQSGIGGSIMAGSEVPYPSLSTTGPTPVKSISYRNVGVSINCSVKEAEDGPRLDLMLEVSDAVPPQKESDAPAFRKVQLNSKALLPAGKPTTVAVIEDPGSRHKFQVDVTATKLK